jgi:hypothetical protein
MTPSACRIISVLSAQFGRHATQITPTPPPLLLQPFENNDVTLIKAKTTYQNKQLTHQRLSQISPFGQEPGVAGNLV